MQFSKIPKHPKILLYGYGLEGKSSEVWVNKNLDPSLVKIFEDNDEPSPDWKNFDLIIKSPGVAPDKIPQKVWPRVTSNLRIFLENITEINRAKVIGITGSKGKSTTAKFTHELFKTAGLKSTIIGNFGVPALEVWDDIESLDYIVAECSSFQLYDAQISTKYALFLSFFADHLEWHNGLEVNYFAAKENLWAYQKEGDVLIIPDSLPAVVALQLTHGKAQSRRTPALISQPVEADLFPEGSILKALHFRQNLGTVWTLAQTLGINNLSKVWLKAAETFEPIEHRLETVRELDGFTFVNDSIATSPDATEAAVEWFGSDLSALILDGADTGVGGLEALIKTLIRCAPTSLIVLVESAISDKFMAVMESKNLNFKVMQSYEDALELIQTEANQGVILLSPSGKSFNRFKNYAERGTVFKHLVSKLT